MKPTSGRVPCEPCLLPEPFLLHSDPPDGCRVGWEVEIDFVGNTVVEPKWQVTSFWQVASWSRYS